MLCALVETFGRDLKIGGRDIGEYLKESDFNIRSPSLPFKSIEPTICLILISQSQDTDSEHVVYLGYWIGTSDVPSIPTILVGESKIIPTVIKRSLNSLFCVEESNIESILKPLISAFSESKDILEQASELPVQTRIKIREQLIRETLKAMKAQDYDIEEYKEKL
jgi:hypothetical protein